MSNASPPKTEIKPTLGLTGLTINAMALIAPGDFLWLTYQEQSLYGTPLAGAAMWLGIVFALVLCFATAISYAELSKLYPGAGSSYLYAPYPAWKADAKGNPVITDGFEVPDPFILSYKPADATSGAGTPARNWLRRRRNGAGMTMFPSRSFASMKSSIAIFIGAPRITSKPTPLL